VTCLKNPRKVVALRHGSLTDGPFGFHIKEDEILYLISPPLPFIFQNQVSCSSLFPIAPEV
jgi:hypothetical protein